MQYLPLEHRARVFWSTVHYVTQQLVTGSHILKVPMSDVGIAVDWSQASKV